MQLPESIDSKLKQIAKLERQLDELRAELRQIVNALQIALGEGGKPSDTDAVTSGPAAEPTSFCPDEAVGTDTVSLEDAIVLAVTELGGEVAAPAVIRRLKRGGLKPQKRTVHTYLARCARTGRIRRVRRGVYAAGARTADAQGSSQASPSE